MTDFTVAVKLLWATDYYDGPLAGLAEVREETIYFVLSGGHDPSVYPRRY